ncbi:PHD finger protein At1g33420-like [Zingiber officinale]|uniref:Zinc finger PHD-type domain-containing protein n=1 Tax=Zingiber officinale TaxID=94328 RepID=A0A8J5HQD1_ZINOF|nr:PHD finger protein At1g33420-like [Zingiber officinale]KAG6528698.1 hypothetical protein ZIOFF_010882 [Zingiber officinale]
MVVNDRPQKRAKRRVTATPFDFLTFPGDVGAVGLDGPFRENIRIFLSLHGRPLAALPILAPSAAPSVDRPHLLTWRVPFRVSSADGREGTPAPDVELYVLEEDVLQSKSIYCDQCRVVGWSDHPVCGKRYHFIIRNDKSSLSGAGVACTRCGALLSYSNLRCLSCSCEITYDSYESWACLLLQDYTHLLHGIVHANGYGHLLRVNGREGGSKYLTGFNIMSFWDRLCKMLHVRKVSVMDISKKHGMDYRLLHAVTVGHPWYGNWGYKFGTGSFALTAESYQKAVDTLSSLQLSIFLSGTRFPRTQLQNTISLYCSLSDCQLLTIRDLFCYLMQLLHFPPAGHKSAEVAAVGALCAWSRDQVDLAKATVIKFLRAVVGPQWVTWRALRRASCHAIKPPELLDYCLKVIVGEQVSNGSIVARYNLDSKTIEYRLEATNSQLTATPCLPRLSRGQLVHDLRFLYDSLLNPITMQPYRPKTVREAALNSAFKLLDCKQLIRHYDEPVLNLLPTNPFVMALWCHVELVDYPDDYIVLPPELLVMPVEATIFDLKKMVTKAFQETYLIFQRFKVEQLVNYEDASDVTPIKTLFGSRGMVQIRGRCDGNNQNLGQYRKERGLDNWIVDCSCGAKDDDGERMMACDVCGVWHHTRCAGIDDSEDPPARFVCEKCTSICKRRGKASGGLENGNPIGRCQDEIRSSFARAGSFECLTTVG